MTDLKPGWQRVKFGDVVRLNKETCKDPEAAGINRVIGLEHLEPGDLRVRSWADVADGTTFSNRVRPGQVLFGKRRAYQRKVAVADFDAICSGDIYVFESADPSRLLPDLLPFICQTGSFFDYAIGTSAGSLSPRTNWKSLAEYEFALPPLEEQLRIADCLRAFKRMEEEYRTVCSTASNLSRSMLANTLPKLRGATPTRLGDISRVVRGSTPRPAGDPRFFNGCEVPWITVSEITKTSSVYLSSTTASLTAEGAKHSRYLKSGTVVLSNSGWTLGVPKVLAIDGCANDGVAAFLELSPAILPEFLYYSLKRLTDYFRIVVAAGGDQPNLNTARIALVEIPLPPIQEQQHFLSEIEALNNFQEVTNERIAITREMALCCEVSA